MSLFLKSLDQKNYVSLQEDNSGLHLLSAVPIGSLSSISRLERIYFLLNYVLCLLIEKVPG